KYGASPVAWEVRFTGRLHFINRFVNYPDVANEQSLDRFFGTTNWRDIRNATDREGASVDLYKEQLRTTGAYAYVTSTRILKPLHERAYFHLAYATRNPKGISKFRDVEKQTVREQEAVRVTAQREHREQSSGQTEIAFEPTGELSSSIQGERVRRLQEAEQRLYSLLRRGPMPYEKLQPRILELRLVWKSDFDTMLVLAHKEGRLAIQGLEPRQRNPKAGNIIEFPEQ
ncbi:MAG: hypothetical protein ABJF23_32110, partial [Bryobacteraceae bacterium]